MLGIVMLQLNLHETDLLFRYLCHHLTWHCSSNYEDLHRFERKSVQIFKKFFNSILSNDGLIIEKMDPSYIHLYVVGSLIFQL